MVLVYGNSIMVYVSATAHAQFHVLSLKLNQNLSFWTWRDEFLADQRCTFTYHLTWILVTKYTTQLCIVTDTSLPRSLNFITAEL
jgi:hypothetical protein